MGDFLYKTVLAIFRTNHNGEYELSEITSPYLEDKDDLFEMMIENVINETASSVKPPLVLVEVYDNNMGLINVVTIETILKIGDNADKIMDALYGGSTIVYSMDEIESGVVPMCLLDAYIKRKYTHPKLRSITRSKQMVDMYVQRLDRPSHKASDFFTITNLSKLMLANESVKW